MKRTESESTISKSNGSSKKPKRSSGLLSLARCLKTRGNVDLCLGKLYKLIPDRKAKLEGYLRVVDESGDDYLYPAADFRVLRFNASDARRLTTKA